MAETTTVNVVFTDLVDSTALQSRLGPQAAEELRVVHFDLLRGALTSHGGTEVKNLGDGLMVIFPSVGAALDGAVGMQQAIDRHNRHGGEQLGIRVGVATGDATRDDDDYFGEPVVEAARLCAACGAGQILVGEVISFLARRSDHEFDAFGELELKGLPEPVPAFLVSWNSRGLDASIPLPRRLHRDSNLALAGRSAHLESLEQAVKEMRTNTSRLTLLAGEPGIGKTRLCSEVATKAHADGVTMLYGRCDQDLSIAYQPWADLLSYLADHAPDDWVSPLKAAHGANLARLVPRLADASAGSPTTSTDPETERYLLFQAVTELVRSVAEEAPLVLVLDDLHWADKPTLQLLRHLYSGLDDASVLILGTYRDSEIGADHPLTDVIASLRRETGFEILSVAGLDDTEMIELVTISAAGHSISDEAIQVARNLRRETDGNPFFAREILRNLVESGDIYLSDDNIWSVVSNHDELSLPQSVRDVVGQRVTRLGDEATNVLRAAAVIGDEFDLALLAAVTGTDIDSLLDLMEEGVEARMLAEATDGTERFRFRHAIVRTTLTADLSDGRRRRLHRQVAEALEEMVVVDEDRHADELATHWMAAAAPIEAQKAIEYSRNAGRRALKALAPDQAIARFTAALEHLDLLGDTDSRVRAELLVELGTAQGQAGHPSYRETLLDAGERAREIGADDLQVAAALANNRGLYSRLGRSDADRISALETALDVVGDAPTADRALLLATLFNEQEYVSTFDGRSTLIDEAIALARSLDDPVVLATVLNRSCVTSAVPHNLALRRERTIESLEIARRLGDPTLEFWALVGSFLVSIASGDRAASDSCLADLNRLAEHTGRPSFRWVAGNLGCVMLSALGEPDALEELATDNLDIGTEAGHPDAFEFYLVLIMCARWMQDRIPEYIEQLIVIAAENTGVEAYSAATARFLCDIDDFERATPYLAEAKARGFDGDLNNPWGTTFDSWALAAAALGDLEACRILYDRLLPAAGQISCHLSFADGSFDGVLGRLAQALGDTEAAKAHYAASRKLTTSFGAKWFTELDERSRAAG